MNTIKHVLLKGNESFLDHTKSIALYGKLYWRKSDKKLNVGDIVLKTEDIHPPKTGISVHFSGSLV